MVVDHCIALDYLLVEQGGICALANTSCCFYINVTGETEISADKILQQAVWLKKSGEDQTTSTIRETVRKAILSLTWFLPFLGPLAAIILLFLFGPCIFFFLLNTF